MESKLKNTKKELVFKNLPLTTNHMYIQGRGYRFLNPKIRERKEAIAWEARMQFKGSPIEGPLTVGIELWWPTRANHDIDNIKMLLDALTGIIWGDDGQIMELNLRKGYDKENPRVEIKIQCV